MQTGLLERRQDIMGRVEDPSLRIEKGVQKYTYSVNRVVRNDKYYRSQKEAAKKWTDKKLQDRIAYNVPAGRKKEIEDYVKAKAKEYPEDTRFSSFNGKGYRPSITAFLNYLIEKETGINMSYDSQSDET